VPIAKRQERLSMIEDVKTRVDALVERIAVLRGYL
jgi:hypothetical protein